MAEDSNRFRRSLSIFSAMTALDGDTAFSIDDTLTLCGNREEIVAYIFLNHLMPTLAEETRSILIKGAAMTASSIQPGLVADARDSDDLFQERKRFGEVIRKLLENEERMRTTVEEYEQIRRRIAMSDGIDHRASATFFDRIL